MKTLYLECGMGAAGDMLMAALLELVDGKQEFIDKLNGLGLPNVEVKARQVKKSGIKGTGIDVFVGGAEEETHDAHIHEGPAHVHGHEHSHGHSAPDGDGAHSHHSHKGLADMEKMINSLELPEKVKKDAAGIYTLIAEAEAFAHGRPVAEVHFHEVGSMDAVTDIVGICMLIDIIAPDSIAVSEVNTGSGYVGCAHGVLPVPAPATEYILRGVPSYSDGTMGELCTPTGAAALKYFSDSFGPRPRMVVEKTGYGMGKKDFDKTNAVRAFLGTAENDGGMEAAEISCNLDDMTGEQIAFAAELLMENGALDVYTVPVQMKKGRPGIKLCCICGMDAVDKMARLVLRHTSTFGVRVNTFRRFCLERRFEKAGTAYGEVAVKHGEGYGVSKCKAEYEDVKMAAVENGVPLSDVYKSIVAKKD